MYNANATIYLRHEVVFNNYYFSGRCERAVNNLHGKILTERKFTDLLLSVNLSPFSTAPSVMTRFFKLIVCRYLIDCDFY